MLLSSPLFLKTLWASARNLLGFFMAEFSNLLYLTWEYSSFFLIFSKFGMFKLGVIEPPVYPQSAARLITEKGNLWGLRTCESDFILRDVLLEAFLNAELVQLVGRLWQFVVVNTATSAYWNMLIIFELSLLYLMFVPALRFGLWDRLLGLLIQLDLRGLQAAFVKNEFVVHLLSIDVFLQKDVKWNKRKGNYSDRQSFLLWIDELIWVRNHSDLVDVIFRRWELWQELTRVVHRVSV